MWVVYCTVLYGMRTFRDWFILQFYELRVYYSASQSPVHGVTLHAPKVTGQLRAYLYPAAGAMLRFSEFENIYSGGGLL